MNKKRTAYVLYNDDGLVHLVELRSQGKDCSFDSWMWCETTPTAWADPPLTTGPATCLQCVAAGRPAFLPNMAGT